MANKTLRALVIILAFAIAGYAIVQYGVLQASSAGLVSFKLTKPNFELQPWIYVLYAHISPQYLPWLSGRFSCL